MPDDIIEIKPNVGEGIIDEIDSMFRHNVVDLTKPEFAFFYRLMFTQADEAGWCDHSVGICWCNAKRTLDAMAQLAGHPRCPHDYDFPKPDDMDKLLGIG